jgi:hypothetical protein
MHTWTSSAWAIPSAVTTALASWIIKWSALLGIVTETESC